MLRRLLLGIILTSIGIGVAAQGAPEPIQDALAAFNQRLGTSLTLNDFFWTWEQQTFPDSSLGCVESGITPFQTSVTGYKFIFEYIDITYEYRVSADRTKTVFCGIVGEPAVINDPDIAGSIDNPAQLSNTLCPAPPEGMIFPRTRLTAGIDARVTAGAPNNLRDQASAAATLIAQIPAGSTVRVLVGPDTAARPDLCDPQGIIWTQVEYNGQIGYTAEAISGEYYLEPLPPVMELPSTRTRITTANLATLRESAKLQGNFGAGLAWSASDKLTVTGDNGSQGVWVYSSGAFTQNPRIVKSLDRFQMLTYSSVATQRDTLLLGADDGSIHMWDLSPSSNLIERLVLNGHNAAISAVAVSPDGRRAASSGGYAFTETEDALNQNAILIWDINNVTQLFVLRGHTDMVTAVAFSPDGATIASASLDGSVRLWDATTGTQTARIDSDIGATTLAFSPDGSILAVGYVDGATLALALIGGISAGPVTATHSAKVNVLAFSPDGGLLLSGANDGSLALRDGANLLSPEAPMLLPDVNSGAISGVAFSPDGTVIASLGQDNTVRLFTAE